MGQGREPGSPQECCRYFPPSSSMYLLCLLLLGDFQNIQLLAVLLYAFFPVILKIFSLLASSISISSKELVAVVVVEKMHKAGIVSSLGPVFPLLPLSGALFPLHDPKELFPVSSPAPVNDHCSSMTTFEINN